MRQELDGNVPLELRVARAVHLAHAARAEQRLHLIRTEPPALDHQLCGVRSAVAPDHRGRLEKALRALVRRQERLHFLAQRLVADAGRGEVGLTLGHRHRPRASEHVFQAPPVFRGESHVRWILLGSAVQVPLSPAIQRLYISPFLWNRRFTGEWISP